MSTRVLAPLRRLGSASAWRATAHTLTGVFLNAFFGLVIGCLFVLWGAAIISLANGATGPWWNPVSYWLAAVLGPVPIAWCMLAFGEVQRERFRAVSGVDIPAPSHRAGPWPVRLVRPVVAAATWRQLAYHVVALVLAVPAGLLVAACWSAVVLLPLGAGQRRPGNWLVVVPLGLALLLAAPWVARGVARADLAMARVLLGAGRGEQLARRVEALSRSRADIIAATDTERRRIERDLHDGAQQRLVSLAMNLGMAQASLAGASEPARQAIASAHGEAIEALAELREVVRGLHPAVLNDRGLDAALSGIAARAPFPVRLRVDMPFRCPPSVEAVAYFVVSEALTNVVKHADARHAEITVARTGDRLRVTVTDDGHGGASVDGAGTGLRGLAQRIAAVDGTLRLHSPRGGPTTLVAELPCG